MDEKKDKRTIAGRVGYALFWALIGSALLVSTGLVVLYQGMQ